MSTIYSCILRIVGYFLNNRAFRRILFQNFISVLVFFSYSCWLWSLSKKKILKLKLFISSLVPWKRLKAQFQATIYICPINDFTLVNLCLIKDEWDILICLVENRVLWLLCSKDSQRNWVFATNFDFLIPISLQPNDIDLRYFKLWFLLDQII